MCGLKDGLVVAISGAQDQMVNTKPQNQKMIVESKLVDLA